MAKIDWKTYTDWGSIFTLGTSAPLDGRIVVETVDDLTNDPISIFGGSGDVTFIYAGIQVYVLDTKETYMYIGPHNLGEGVKVEDASSEENWSRIASESYVEERLEEFPDRAEVNLRFIEESGGLHGLVLAIIAPLIIDLDVSTEELCTTVITMLPPTVPLSEAGSIKDGKKLIYLKTSDNYLYLLNNVNVTSSKVDSGVVKPPIESLALEDLGMCYINIDADTFVKYDGKVRSIDIHTSTLKGVPLLNISPNQVYLSEQEIKASYQPKGDYLTEVPEEYVKTSDVEEKISQAKSEVKEEILGTDLSDSLEAIRTFTEWKEQHGSEYSNLVQDVALKATKEEISDMATQTWVNKQNYLTEHQSLDEYYTKSEIDGKNYLTEVPEEYATKGYVEEKVAEALLGGEEVDLSAYLTKEEASLTYLTEEDIANIPEKIHINAEDEVSLHTLNIDTSDSIRARVDEDDNILFDVKNDFLDDYLERESYLKNLPIKAGEGYNSIITNDGEEATGRWSHAEGMTTAAYGDSSHAEGADSTARGEGSHAEGENTNTYGDYSHAEGGNTIAMNRYEHASGYYNKSDIQSLLDFTGNELDTLFTIGNGNDDEHRHNAFLVMQNGEIWIPNLNTDAEFYETPMMSLLRTFNNKANTDDIVLFKGTGEDSIKSKYGYASGDYSIAFGMALAIGENSFAMGSDEAKAIGWSSFAGGGMSEAKGDRSFAFGDSCFANGGGSFAVGAVTTNNLYECAIGHNNQSIKTSDNFGDHNNTLYSIGNGGLGLNTNHNAHEIRQDGTHFIPDVYAEGEYYEKPMINLQEKLKNIEEKCDSIFEPLVINVNGYISELSSFTNYNIRRLTEAEVEAIRAGKIRVYLKDDQPKLTLFNSVWASYDNNNSTISGDLIYYDNYSSKRGLFLISISPQGTESYSVTSTKIV